MTLLWLQAGSCGGCTMSVLDNGAQGWPRELHSFGIDLLWHPSLSEESGVEAIAILESVAAGETPLDILCIEGSILRGPSGTGLCNRLAGTGRTMLERSWLIHSGYCGRRHLRILWRHHAASPDPAGLRTSLKARHPAARWAAASARGPGCR
jgi:ferredoxin hydrogenase small subunit